MDNLIVQISWGQMPSYCSSANIYRNYKTETVGLVDMTKQQYSDAAPPLTSTIYAREYYSNIQLHYVPFNPPGAVEGFVTNCDGLPIWQTIVYAVDYPQYNTMTDNSGYYI